MRERRESELVTFGEVCSGYGKAPLPTVASCRMSHMRFASQHPCALTMAEKCATTPICSPRKTGHSTPRRSRSSTSPRLLSESMPKTHRKSYSGGYNFGPTGRLSRTQGVFRSGSVPAGSSGSLFRLSSLEERRIPPRQSRTSLTEFVFPVENSAERKRESVAVDLATKETASKETAFVRLNQFLLKAHLASLLSAMREEGFLELWEKERICGRMHGEGSDATMKELVKIYSAFVESADVSQFIGDLRSFLK